MKTNCRLFLILANCLLTATHSFATNYYVSTTGNNTYNGLTTGTAWKTVNYAVNYSALKGGDTILILSGTYNERVVMTKSGNATSRIVVTKYQTTKPIIDGNGISWTANGVDGLFHVHASYVTIDGIEVKNATPHPNAVGILIKGPNVTQVTIRNCKTNNTRSSGIACWGYSSNYNGATDIIIENNTVSYAVNNGYQEHLTISYGVERFEVRNNIVEDGAPDHMAPNKPIGIDAKVNVREGKIFENTIRNLPKSNGIYVDSWDSHAYNIDIYNNIVHHVGYAGIQVGGEEGGISNNIKVYNNLVYSCGENGLKVSASYGNPSIYDVMMFNNTVYGCGHASAIVEGNTGAVMFKNNIFSGNGWNNGVYIYSSNKANVTVSNNVVWQFLNRSYTSPAMEEIKGTSVIEQNPMFINTSTNDFRLLAGSPAINAGTESGLTLPATDLDGNNRLAGTVDIGPYEYGSSSVTPVLTAEPPVASFSARIYPNLSKGIINVMMTDMKGAKIRVYNLNGQIVWHGRIDKNIYTIDLSSLHKGKYLVAIFAQERKLVSPVILY